MRNVQFLVAGIFLLIFILAATLVVDQEAPVPVPPGDEVEQGELITVQAYFSSTSFDSNVEHCDVVYPVPRTVVETPALPKAALEEVMRGVTATEMEQGYFSSLPPEGELESLIISQGVATVTFSEDFKNGLAGSCRVAAVRAQIEQTLKQFNDITTVHIRITGVPDEEVLQP